VVVELVEGGVPGGALEAAAEVARFRLYFFCGEAGV